MVRITGGAAALAAGCGGDGPTSPTPSFPGIYTLRAIDGRPLPFVLSSDAFSESEVVSDSLTFDAAGGFTQQATLRLTQRATSGQPTTTQPFTMFVRGTWTLTGTTVVLRTADGASTTATVAQNTTLTAPITYYAGSGPAVAHTGTYQK